MKNFFTALVFALAVLFVANPVCAQPVEFTILHTSDVHAHLLPVASGSEEVGGYARIKAYKDSLEQQGHNVLMLSSGDIFQGTFFYKFFQGIPDVEFMNRTGYAAMTLGNHEFDGGQAALAEAISYAQFPVLSANIQFKKIPELQAKLKPWVIVDAGPAEKPVKVGIIGLTVENLHEIVPAVFLRDIDVIDAQVALRRCLPEVKAAGAEVILVLAHLGWDRELELFEKFPEVDGFLGGHTHLEICPPAVIDGPQGHRFISQPGEWGKNVTRYDIVFNPGADRNLEVVGAGLVSMNSKVSEDRLMKKQIEGLWNQIQVKVNVPISETAVFLNGERSSIRTRETNLGNLVADCVAQSTGAEMAMLNGGGIRSSIATGTVTIGDCLNVLPFDNYLIKVKLSGATITRIFEQVRKAALNETGFGGFLQISKGFQVRYFNNVVLVSFNGKPLDPERIYVLATNDFLAGGGNGLSAFLEAEETESTGILAADAFIRFVKKNQQLCPVEEGRILTYMKPHETKMPKGLVKKIPVKF